MHHASLADDAAQGHTARRGGAAELAMALQASRRDTLATFAAYVEALPTLTVPRHADLNPPLWELGHIGWFQEFWLTRFPQRGLGHRADPRHARLPPVRSNADALYNSSDVPHGSRWGLALPDAQATREDLQTQLAANLALLAQLDDDKASDDDALYFFRLALHHEDMHHEAALYMAQALGIPIKDPRWQAAPLPAPPPPLTLKPGAWRLGSEAEQGFTFDNERCGHAVVLGETEIDAQAVRWAEFLPFVEAHGYADDRWWTPAGLQWRQAHGAIAPRYLRQGAGTWQQRRHDRWQPLNLREAACHLSYFEAEAWCRWAGRRLPSEAEWERAACASGSALRWGDVWEWTASAFTPYPGFEPHPYRDYSAPWFDGRPVLRGASFLTQPRMRHPRYRNFFMPGRNDVPAGFRSCRL